MLTIISEAAQAGYDLAKSESEWVSVDDRLPEKSGYQIAWLESPSEHGLIHFHVEAGWQNGFYNDRVTHWIELTPPKSAQ